MWKLLGHVLFVLAALALFARPAGAEDVRRGGTVRLEAPGGGKGPIELRADPAAKEDTFAAELAIVNDGKEPLIISRIAPRADPSDPRVPPKLVAHLTEGSLPITIAPGATRRAQVVWTPEKGIRAKQLFGHIVVTSSDERSGEVAMGVRAQMPSLFGPLESRLLSLVLLLPLLGAIAAIFLGRDFATARVLAIVALSVQGLLAAYIYRGFIPQLSRIDGNDGLQFIQHIVWVRPIGLELFLAVDGIAATALLVGSLVALFAVIFDRGPEAGPGGHHSALLLLDAAFVGALTAQDGLLFVVFTFVAIISATLLVGLWGGGRRKTAALRLALPGLIAASLLLVAVLAISRKADSTFLVDGTSVEKTFSLPELSRVALSAKEATFLGLPFVKIMFAMVLAAVVLLVAAFPAHRWLGDVLAEAPPAAGILIATALPSIGLCAFLRLGCLVLPDGMRWSAGIIVAIGAVTAAYGALGALGQTDLRRIAASATTTQAGFVFLGAGSLTPQGLSGAIVLSSTRALACSLFLLLASTAFDRAKTTDTNKLGGVGRLMPAWTIALAASALAQAGVLGLGGAWGPLLALLGVLSSYAPLAIVAAIALVVVAAAHLTALSRVAFGATKAAQIPAASLTDLSRREWVSIGPLVLGLVILGIWPAPVVTVTTGTVRDLSNAVSPPGPDQVAMK
ncbi:MAG: proton-conducting transporter membrane subunit [Labilithrix sp.]